MNETLVVAVAYLLIGAVVLGFILSTVSSSEVENSSDIAGFAVILLWPLIVMIALGVWIGGKK